MGIGLNLFCFWCVFSGLKGRQAFLKKALSKLMTFSLRQLFFEHPLSTEMVLLSAPNMLQLTMKKSLNMC